MEDFEIVDLGSEYEVGGPNYQEEGDFEIYSF